MSRLVHYHKFIITLVVSFCLNVCAAKTDDLKRNPFEWSGNKKIKVDLPVEEKSKEKKTLHIAWKVIGISSGEYALLTNNTTNIVVRVGTDIDKEWKVEKITNVSVVCKHMSGLMRELNV